MLKRFVAITVSAALAGYAGQACALDLCQAPGPPPDQSLRPVAPVKPVTPSCINQETRISSCRFSVLKAYNASVNDYNVALSKFNLDSNAYIEALNRWARTGVEYANCEIQVLNREVNQ